MLRKIKGIAGSPAMTLAAALACGAPVTFWNAFRYSPPMGYAGMFSLMAELIVNAGFGLPMEVPYYGPGGVPFAYPPLGLYLLAVFIQVTGKTLIILRFIPPLLSLLALIPLFFLAIEISGSRLVGFVAVFLASVSL